MISLNNISQQRPSPPPSLGPIPPAAEAVPSAADAAALKKEGQDYLKEAREHKNNHQPEKAQKAYARAIRAFIKVSPKTEDVQALLDRSYSELGDVCSTLALFDRASFSYRQVQADYGDTLKRIREALPTYNATTFPTTFFKSNLPLVSAGPAVVASKLEIKNTRHLADCLKSSALSAEQKGPFRTLALDVLKAFATPDTSLALWQEIVPLAPISDKQICENWIDIIFKALLKEVSLNQPALRSLDVMLRNFPKSLLEIGRFNPFLVKLLAALNVRLNFWNPHSHLWNVRTELTPSGEVEELQLLLQTTSQLLDTMVRARIKGISRTELRDPLNGVLSELRVCYPALSFQAQYACQALERIPNDESLTEEIASRLLNTCTFLLEITSSSVGVARAAAGAYKAGKQYTREKGDPKLVPGEAIDARNTGNFGAWAGGAADVAKAGPKVKAITETAASFYRRVMGFEEVPTAVTQAITGRVARHPWYEALQLIDACFVEEGRIVELEKFVRGSPCKQDEYFLQGLCQRLEYIAGTQNNEAQHLKQIAQARKYTAQSLEHIVRAQQANEASQQAQKVAQKAVEFIGDLARNESQCRAHESVKQAALAALKRLDAVLPQASELLKLLDPGILTQMRDATQQAETHDDILPPVWDSCWHTLSPPTNLLEKQLNDTSWPTLSRKIQGLRVKNLKTQEAIDAAKDVLVKYVEPECTVGTNASKPLPLIPEVDKFLNSKEKILFLFGEAGSGKSMFNQRLARDLWETYNDVAKLDDHSLPIPLFIDLPSLSQGLNDSPFNLISTYLKKNGLVEAQIDVLQETRRFVFILDSYDELAGLPREFYVDNELANWKNAQFIVSSRREYLGSGTDYQKYFQPPGQKTRLLPELHLAPFSDKAIEIYIENYVDQMEQKEPSFAEKCKGELLKGQFDLKELIRVPLLLKMALDVLSTSSEAQNLSSDEQPLTRTGLYDKFVDRWFELPCRRLTRNVNPAERGAFNDLAEDFSAHGVHFSQRFALAMYESKEVKVTYSTVCQNGNPSSCNEFLNTNNVKNRLLRRGSPIIRQGDKDPYEYKFIHKSFRDYFVARLLREQAQQQVKEQARFNHLNAVRDPDVLRFLIEWAQQEPVFKGKLLDWIKLGAGFETAAANALTILVKAGVQFNGENLNGIKVPGADLSYGVFDQTQFKRADLSDVKFRGAWLRGANLRGAILGGVNFGERPSLEVLSEVNDCCYSRHRHKLAIGTFGGEIKLYQTDTLEQIHTPMQHGRTVTSVDFSPPEGQFLASGSLDGTVKLWSVELGIGLHTLRGHSDGVLSVRFSPNGEFLASGSRDKTVRLSSVEREEEPRIFNGHISWVTSVDFSPPEGQFLASGSLDRTVKLWRYRDEGETAWRTLVGHSDGVLSVRFSPNGEFLASGSRDKTVRLWSVEREEEPRTFKGHSGWVRSVRFSPEDGLLASGSDDGTVKLWNVERAEALHTLEGHSGWVKSVDFSPDGEFLASGSDDKTVRLWSVYGGEALHTLEGHSGRVKSVNFWAPNGELLASGSTDETVKLWSVENREVLHTLNGHSNEVLNVNFSADGEFLVSGCRDKTLELWSVKSGERLRKLDSRHSDKVSSVNFSLPKRNNTLASGSRDGTVKLWNVGSQNELRTLRGHSWAVTSVSFSPPHGELLAAGGWDGSVKLWDVETGEELPYMFEEHSDEVTSVDFSLPEDKPPLLASGSMDGTVKLWKYRDEGETSWRTLRGHRDGVLSVRFSPDGGLIASGSRDKTVRLWRVESGEALRTFKGFVGGIDSIVWQESHDGGIKMAVAGGRGRAVHIWKIKPIISIDNDWEVGLHWVSSQNELTLTDMFIQDARSLSPINKRLLGERGARGNPA